MICTIVDGAHMWGVWRLALAAFLPRLFKPAAPAQATPSASADGLPDARGR